MTNKQAQELLIQNGQLVADTLRHLADNEIDSDYFAITSTSENGTEIEHELVITEYARHAAGTVDELVKALTAPAITVTLPAGYAVRPGHPINETERGVMIPKDNGPWLSRHDVEHALRLAGIRIHGEG